jgi:hypothetical protein
VDTAPGVDNTAWTLPSGGQWLIPLSIARRSSDGIVYAVASGIYSGGSTVLPATVGIANFGTAWRYE